MNNQNSRKGKEERIFVRVDYRIPVDIDTTDVTISTMKGELCDVSAQGAMFIADSKLHNGLFVKLHFKLRKNHGTLMGYVKWQKKVEDKYQVGIIFDESHAEQNDRVVELITEEIISEIRSRQK